MPKSPVTPYALISVADKTGIVPLARSLLSHGYALLSTGGSAKVLREHQLTVTDVADYTGFPEMLGGRVKSLHPKIHAGILARRGQDDATLSEHGIAPIDIVIVNLYPFAATIAEPDCTLDAAVEQIDIGGPTLLRAAAKNYASIHVLVDPNDYATLQNCLANDSDDIRQRFLWARKVFSHTAYFDALIHQYLCTHAPCDIPDADFPEQLTLPLQKVSTLRYGENPHQKAAFYHDPLCATRYPGALANAELKQGKPLSFNNLNDADSALACVRAFIGGTQQAACAIIKHANPCGVAVADTPLSAYLAAYQCDPLSAFGGIIACNRPIDAKTATAMLERQFIEVLLAPEFSADALAVLAQKPNLRVLAYAPTESPKTQLPSLLPYDGKRLYGGFLLQEHDTPHPLSEQSLQVVTREQPSASTLADLHFAWQVAHCVKSNAIVCAKDGATRGIGAGQMSRVDSVTLACLKAQHSELSLEGSVAASDAFFPFADGIEALAAAGIRAIIQPGGSKRDAEVIAAADNHAIAMVFTGQRHFKH